MKPPTLTESSTLRDSIKEILIRVSGSGADGFDVEEEDIDAIIALFQQHLEWEIKGVVKDLEDMIEVEPVIDISGQKVVSLSWLKYLDLKSCLSKPIPEKK